MNKNKKYLLSLFDHSQELVSYCHEVTDDGVFTKKDLELMDDETLAEVAEDLEYQMKVEARL